MTSELNFGAIIKNCFIFNIMLLISRIFILYKSYFKLAPRALSTFITINANFVYEVTSALETYYS